MCGRFTRFHTWGDIQDVPAATDATETDATPRRVTTSRRPKTCISSRPAMTAARRCAQGRWWFVPWWAKEMPKQPMFNAGFETADTGGAFKDAWKSKRCLVPADGLYEWTKNAEDGGRDPWFIHLPGTAHSASRASGRTTQARRDELHDYHHAGGGAYDRATLSPAGHTRARCL